MGEPGQTVKNPALDLRPLASCQIPALSEKTFCLSVRRAKHSVELDRVEFSSWVIRD